jgi:hypothetical protein
MVNELIFYVLMANELIVDVNGLINELVDVLMTI